MKKRRPLASFTTRLTARPASEFETVFDDSNVTILTDRLPAAAPYAVPSDLPKPLRDTIRQLHREKQIDYDNIAWMFSLPAEWVETICDGRDLEPEKPDAV